MATPRWQQRDHIYVVGPPLLPPSAPTPQLPNEFSALSSLAPGQAIYGLEVTLDKDAPFVMRRRAARVAYDTAQAATFRLQKGINNLLVRFSGHDKQYVQQSPVPLYADGAFYGQLGAWKPIYPGMAFPAGGSFLIDIINNSPTLTLTNVTLYFRGVKLYPWGVRPDYRYPAVCSSLPYYYTINQVTPSNPLGVVQALGVTDIRQSQVFQVQDDADYVIRAWASGAVPINQIAAFEVFTQLRDFDFKPYSTGWVHMDVYAGQTGAEPIFPVLFTTSQAFGTGASLPNVFFPEIYVPKNQILFYDIMRLDAAYPGGVSPTTQDYPITMIGAKVFDRTA